MDQFSWLLICIISLWSYGVTNGQGTRLLSCHPVAGNCRFYNFMLEENEEVEFEVAAAGEMKLKFEATVLGKLPQNIFSHFRKVRYVDASNASIRELPKQTFDNGTHLETLILMQNNITKLEKGNFEKLTALTLLDLSQNLIAELDEESFGGLQMLAVLSLESNQIKALPDGIFKFLPRVESICLANNVLDKIQEGLFSNQQMLKTLDLGENGLTSADLSSVRAETVLIDLSNNSLIELNVRTLHSKTLMIKGNHLESLYIGEKIREVHAAANQIKNLTCADRLALEYADFDNNSISDLLCVSRMIRVRTLLLVGNQLEKITEDDFRNLTELRYLSLEGNKLTDIEKFAMMNLQNLISVFVSDNQLKNFDIVFLDEDRKRKLPSLKRIALQGNQWNCDYLNAFLKDLDASAVKILDSMDGNGLKESNVRGIACKEKEQPKKEEKPDEAENN